jgi:hypothetical protein
MAALGGAVLSGCDAAPMPPDAAQLRPQADVALLKPQPAPKCEAPRESKGGGEAAVGKAVATDDATRLRKLDYEAQCYRHAEIIARTRLGRLQASVHDKARAEKVKKTSAAPPDATVPPSSAF